MIVTDVKDVPKETLALKEKFDKYMIDNKIKKIYKTILFQTPISGYVLVLNKHFFIPLEFKSFTDGSGRYYLLDEPASKISDIAVRIDMKVASVFVKHPKTTKYLHPHSKYGSFALEPDGWYGTCIGNLKNFNDNFSNEADYFKLIDGATALFARAKLDSTHFYSWITNDSRVPGDWLSTHKSKEIKFEEVGWDTKENA